MDNIKLVVIGDGAVGKTSLLETCVTKKYPKQYIPTVFENYPDFIFQYKDKKYKMNIFDTAGGEDYYMLRPLIYPNTDVFLLCYSIDNPRSFENVKSYWLPELKRYEPEVPIFLVATKIDLLETNDKDSEIITTEQGHKMAEEIGALDFIEVSALNGTNVDDVFGHVVEINEAHKKNMKASNNGQCCIYLVPLLLFDLFY
ncbi:GTPase_rho, putative [Entamoeba dispar SAW760]|uniref:small monomeric GTPase n=1 Tax=Entamoeba dispar (strain ATCC PRA-260 / SAW760) TaxID=370354 RepID=B0EU26_ENTDS|nr:GTPase_rho, putative [Entamoeba dispar SAW760]EDR21970.1 GTPase_rho, putative [Entamoeba dispar SAW760]|eukprot:EDR21970.1 GTPase_rho, putative [Entamoeba dispar SAW760]